MNDKPKTGNGKPSADVMSSDYIKSLAEIMAEHNLSKIKIQDSNVKLSIKRGADISADAFTAMMTPQMQMPQMQAMPAGQMAQAAAQPSAEPISSDKIIKSPMVGNVYLAPQPDTPRFTDVGKKVKEGDTILIVEAMKVMNPITATCSGIVTKIHVQNGQPVEFEENLISINPA